MRPYPCSEPTAGLEGGRSAAPEALGAAIEGPKRTRRSVADQPSSTQPTGSRRIMPIMAEGDAMGRLQGTIEEWNDDRGFGFISRPTGERGRVFVHISAFPRGRRPTAVAWSPTSRAETSGADAAP